MYLGLDIGTSAVKAALMRDDGALAAVADAPLGVSSPRPGWREQDPEDWWTATQAAAAALPAADRARVAGVGLSGQMHAAALLDAADRPVRPAILWSDGRAAAQAARLAAQPWVAETAGAPPLPGLTAPKLMWLKAQEPQTYARIRSALGAKDCIGLRLHGARATDRSDAAGTLWLDQAARAWSPRLCAASDTDPAWLPPLLDGPAPAGTLRAEAAAALGLPADIPVATGGGDVACGAVGLGAVSDGDGFASLGTSGQLFVTTDSYRPAPGDAVHAFAHCLPARWFQMAAMLNGARPLRWFADVCGLSVEAMLAEAAAAGPADDAAPLFLPYLSGERTPHADPAIRAAFFGLDDATGRPAMARAVVEAVAFSFADAAAALRRAGATVAAPLAIGGGARSDLLCQALADALGAPVRRAADAQAGAALGAARLAMACATGDAACLSVPAAVAATFDPAPGPAQPARLARWRALYQALRTV